MFGFLTQNRLDLRRSHADLAQFNAELKERSVAVLGGCHVPIFNGDSLAINAIAACRLATVPNSP